MILVRVGRWNVFESMAIPPIGRWIVYDSMGWFSCDHMCQRNKKRMEHAEAVLEDVRLEGDARMSDAIHSFWQYCYGARYRTRRWKTSNGSCHGGAVIRRSPVGTE
jgi:hypothetical protein